MKKILLSVLSIAVVGGVAFGATRAFFSDVEKSEGNVLAAGIIDISVDDSNPWNKIFSEELKDMKPSEVRYIEFTVKNLEGSNDVNLWKHIDITDQTDGVITEPECTEGGGQWTGGETTTCTDPAQCCSTTTNYTPRNNLAAYTIYDLWVCYDPNPDTGRCWTDPVTHKPSFGENWIPIIKENQYVRLDNVSSSWISLGRLNKGQTLKVVQSYHLSSWPNAPEPEVGNWAQGDILTFDIELMAMQLNAPGPEGYQTTLNLDNKDANWNPVTDDIKATLTYKTSGPTFDYSLSGTVKNASTDYCLIYYADPWPGDGTEHNTGALIGKATSVSNSISIPSTQVELGIDLPNVKDQNYPAGAKIWLIPCDHYSAVTVGSQGYMTQWNPTEYLFEMNLITYDDTNL